MYVIFKNVDLDFYNIALGTETVFKEIYVITEVFFQILQLI